MKTWGSAEITQSVKLKSVLARPDISIHKLAANLDNLDSFLKDEILSDNEIIETGRN